MSDELQNAATIASLRASLEAAEEREESLQAQMKYVRQALDERNAYAERLLAENVQLTNRQTMDREEIESMGKRNDELRSEVSAIGTRLSMEQEDHAATRNELDAVVILLDGQRVLRKEAEARAESLSHSIIAACAGSGCLNAHELRHALDTARERAGVLERECRIFRTGMDDHDNGPFIVFADGVDDVDAGNFMQALDMARDETDRTHALDAAKFGGAT